MIYTLLITAFTVSIDSFFCGFSLSLMGGKKLPVILSIFTTVLIMCLIANYTAMLFINASTVVPVILGGALLVLIGFFNLLKKENTVPKKTNGKIQQSIISGLAVGVDGALANVSLSLMGINAFYVPITIALFHALTIYLGMVLAKTKFISKLKKFDFIAPLILILLGVYKIITALI